MENLSLKKSKEKKQNESRQGEIWTQNHLGIEGVVHNHYTIRST